MPEATEPLQLVQAWLAEREAQRKLNAARNALHRAEVNEYDLASDSSTVVPLPGTEQGSVIVKKKRTISDFGATRHEYSYEVAKVVKNA